MFEFTRFSPNDYAQGRDFVGKMTTPAPPEQN
jgi:hypothetical protein